MTAQGQPSTSAPSVTIWYKTSRNRDRGGTCGRNTKIRESFLAAIFINFQMLCQCLALNASFLVGSLQIKSAFSLFFKAGCYKICMSKILALAADISNNLQP